MPRLAFALTLLLATPPLYAQPETAPQGTVVYEDRARFSVTETSSDPAQERRAYEHDRVERFQMAFHGATAMVSSSQAATNIPAEAIPDGPEGALIWQVAQGGGQTLFLDVDAGVRLRQVTQLGRTFLIEVPLVERAWRLTGDVSEYLGYEVHKAVAETDAGPVEAWFAPAIPAPVGPAAYYGLPGLVLLVTEPGERRTYAAVEIVLGPLDTLPVAPEGGVRVTEAEFQRTMLERVEQLQRMAEGMGGVEVKIIRNN